MEDTNSMKRRELSNKLMFLLLILTVIYLFGFTFLNFWGIFNYSFYLLGMILFGIMVAGFRYSHEFEPASENEAEWKASLKAVLASTAGSLLTYWASQDLGIGPVLASAAVGLLGSFLLPKFCVEIYTGSFVGMCSKGFAPQYSWLLLAGIIAGLIFYASRHVLIGSGGKLGTIALTSVILASLIGGGQLPAATPQAYTFTWAIIFSSAAAAGLTWLLADHEHMGVVRASSLVGLVGGLALPFFFPAAGSVHAGAAFCATFVGMASHERMPKLWMVVFAGAIAGAVFQFSAPLFSGMGGKMGTIALGSVMAVRGYKTLFQKWPPANTDQSSG